MSRGIKYLAAYLVAANLIAVGIGYALYTNHQASIADPLENEFLTTCADLALHGPAIVDEKANTYRLDRAFAHIKLERRDSFVFCSLYEWHRVLAAGTAPKDALEQDSAWLDDPDTIIATIENWIAISTPKWNLRDAPNCKVPNTSTTLYSRAISVDGSRRSVSFHLEYEQHNSANPNMGGTVKFSAWASDAPADCAKPQT